MRPVESERATSRQPGRLFARCSGTAPQPPAERSGPPGLGLAYHLLRALEHAGLPFAEPRNDRDNDWRSEYNDGILSVDLKVTAGPEQSWFINIEPLPRVMMAWLTQRKALLASEECAEKVADIVDAALRQQFTEVTW